MRTRRAELVRVVQLRAQAHHIERIQRRRSRRALTGSSSSSGGGGVLRPHRLLGGGDDFRAEDITERGLKLARGLELGEPCILIILG